MKSRFGPAGSFLLVDGRLLRIATAESSTASVAGTTSLSSGSQVRVVGKVIR